MHKYLPATDILVGASTVHSVWTRASDSPELWSLLCESLDSPCLDLPPKSAYRAHSFASVRLPLLTEHTLQFFNCARDRWESAIPLSQPLLVDQSSSVVTQTDGSVFVCGGLSSRGKGYLSDSVLVVRSGNVIPLSPMTAPRVHHSLIEVNGICVHFWGKSRDKKQLSITILSCEKWRAPADLRYQAVSWEALPDAPITAWGSNPCRHKSVVYLYSIQLRSIAVFDTDVGQFTSWPPITQSRQFQQACVLFTHVHLLELQTSFLGKYQLPDCTLAALPRFPACSPTNPLLIAGKVYHVDFASGITFCIDIQEARMVKTYKSQTGR